MPWFLLPRVKEKIPYHASKLPPGVKEISEAEAKKLAAGGSEEEKPKEDTKKKKEG